MARGGSRPGERRGGRRKGTPNKATADVRALAQRYAPAAVKELGRLSVEAESEQARVAAIREILDRAYGKSTQAVQHSGPNNGPILTADLTKATDDELRALEAVFGPLAGEPGGDDGGDSGGEGEADG